VCVLAFPAWVSNLEGAWKMHRTSPRKSRNHGRALHREQEKESVFPGVFLWKIKESWSGTTQVFYGGFMVFMGITGPFFLTWKSALNTIAAMKRKYDVIIITTNGLK
jgi:hypothetical protein